MSSAMLSLSNVEQFAVATLVAVVWQAALIAGATALALRLVPRLSAAARFWTWSVVFAIMLLLPFAQHARSTGTLTGWKVSPYWSAAIAGVWLLLSIFRSVQLLREFLRVRRIRANAVPLRRFPEGSQARVSSGVVCAVCLSADVGRPTVLGFFRPSILIPQSLYGRLSADELEHILLHEAQHLRRRDLWLNLLQKLALVLFPLNPALFWVERRLCFERELACDESVLALTHAPQSYALSLVSLAEHSLLGRQISLALGAWGQPSELSRRVYRILAVHAPALSPRSAYAVVALLCAGLLGSAAMLSGAPRLVAFSGPSRAALASMDTPHLAAAGNGNDLRMTSVTASAALPRLAPAVMRTQSEAAVAAQPMLRAAHRRTQPAASRRVIASDAPAGRPAANAYRLRAAYTQSEAREPGPVSRRIVALQQRSAEHLVSPTVVLTVFASPNPSPTYAAVPTANGWIVFEL